MKSETLPSCSSCPFTLKIGCRNIKWCPCDSPGCQTDPSMTLSYNSSSTSCCDQNQWTRRWFSWFTVVENSIFSKESSAIVIIKFWDWDSDFFFSALCLHYMVVCLYAAKEDCWLSHFAINWWLITPAFHMSFQCVNYTQPSDSIVFIITLSFKSLKWLRYSIASAFLSTSLSFTTNWSVNSCTARAIRALHIASSRALIACQDAHWVSPHWDKGSGLCNSALNANCP